MTSLGQDGLGKRLRLSVAGMHVELVSDELALRLALPRQSLKFVSTDSSADIRVGCSLRDLSNFDCPGKCVFDSHGLWKLNQNGCDYWFQFHSPITGSSPYRVARFNERFTEGEIFLNRPFFERAEHVYPLEYPLDELLIVHLLGQGIGVDVHSCGMTDSTGTGYLFVGQSGAGKTTSARLWSSHSKVTVLSDDRIIVRKNEGQFKIYGTPWHGEAELSEAANAPLRAVFLLKQSAQNTLTPIRGATAAARLLACSFLPFHNREAIDFTLGFLGELAAAVPCYEFGFRNDVSAVEFLKDRIK